MNDSILTQVKKIVGIGEEYDHFDVDIIMHINTAFSYLYGMGAGPSTGYRITDKTNVWAEFTDDLILLDPVKTYVCFRTKLVFDPPSGSSLLEALKSEISQAEYRIRVRLDDTQR